MLKAQVLESKSRLKDKDHNYFSQRLGLKHSWRAYESFKDSCICLDIETTGLSSQTDKVTTVCIYDGFEPTSYVLGDNLESLAEDVSGYKMLITYNGARFDIPFLEANLGIEFNHIHLDLMYPLHQLGYYGGLKKVESDLGLTRATDGIDGKDAVRLWNAYEAGDDLTLKGQELTPEESLKLLVKYNEEDTVNLLTLAEFTVKMMGDRARKYLA